MTRTVASSVATAIVLVCVSTAWAGPVPAVRTSATNAVPACATPGRLTAYLKSRNDNLDPRFEKIAVEYMRHGERLGLRWDYTFFQMLLETGYLTFRGDGGRRGDVKPTQNNFAGLGATGNREPGESFPDVSTGVLAHLQHVLIYAGETVENPVAERTRKVQEWGILKSMQKRAKGAVTFAHLATKWAPGSNYVAGIEAIAGRFRDGFCNAPDPHPEWIAEARGQKPVPAAVAAAMPPAEPSPERVSGADLAKRAIAEGKAENDNRAKGLGAGGLLAIGNAAANTATPPYSILNAPRPDASASVDDPQSGNTDPEPARPGKAAKVPARPDATQASATASAAGALLPRNSGKTAPDARPSPGAKAAAAPTASKCRVWTASYGGQKALIIRVNGEKSTDYTVLDVNEGAERREAEAYIAAYAKGGAIEAEFANQTQALEKAFELCPEN